MTAVEFLQAQFDKHLYYVEGYYNAKPYTLQDLVNDFDTALAMERTANWKEEQLQQRIKELEDKVIFWGEKWNESVKQQGKFAEWASLNGWMYADNWGIWMSVRKETYTTPELWAEFDKRNDNVGSNRHD